MKELQRRVKEFNEQHNLDCSIEYRILDIMSELGEITKEILVGCAYGKRPLFIEKTHTHEELGDLFYSLFCLANTLNVDIEEILNKTIHKYEQRVQSKGSAGSED